jgi:molybdenum cofactor cytidylyltransferase
VVLAAGGGSRFAGGPKLLAPFNGRPLVSWALCAAVSAGLDASAVVTAGHHLGDVVPAPMTVIVNPRWADGQASSLAVAVAWAKDHGVVDLVVGLGDQPRIPAEAWRAVAAARGTPISVATYNGRRGNPVRLGREIWPLLPTEGDEGARSLFSRHPELVTFVACDGDPTDVDTVQDLHRLVREHPPRGW